MIKEKQFTTEGGKLLEKLIFQIMKEFQKYPQWGFLIQTWWRGSKNLRIGRALISLSPVNSSSASWKPQILLKKEEIQKNHLPRLARPQPEHLCQGWPGFLRSREVAPEEVFFVQQCTYNQFCFLPVQRSSVAGYIAKFFSKLELEDGSGEVTDHVVILQENVDIGLQLQMAKDRI